MDTQKIKNTIINFLVPILSLVTCLILFVTVIYPSFTRIPLLRQDLEGKTKLRDVLSDKKIRLGRFIDFKTVLEENSMLVNRVMPDEENVPGLLDQVDQIARESGFDVTRLSYSLGETGSNEANDVTYSSVLISLGADGTYPQMVSFMKAIESASRMVNITNYRFSTGSGEETDVLSLTFILSAPFMKVQSSAVTDEPLVLDLASPDFVAFINKVKGLRYFEKSGDSARKLGNEVSPEEIIEALEEAEQTSESSQSQ